MHWTSPSRASAGKSAGMKKTAEEAEKTITVFVVDDEPLHCEIVSRILKKLDIEVSVYTNPEKCLSDIREKSPDIVISDLRMPSMDGLELLEKVKTIDPVIDMIILTGNADKKAAIQALKLGAFDFFEKPVDQVELLETVKRTLRYRALVRERDQFAEQVSQLSKREAERWGIEAFIAKSKAMKQVIHEIQLLQKAANTSVLVTGESGTGKELVARAVHFGGNRSSKPFVPVNCPGIPAELAESILFGHVRGSFTGATGDKKGCFAQADGGTLFLDEIGDMPINLQTKILRVLEDGMITPVGGSESRKVNVRIIAATNAELESKITGGSFRKDLYFRLAGYSIKMPPLRSRKDDIYPLVIHFAEKNAFEMGMKMPQLTAEAATILNKHDYPGNVRELRNIVERAMIESNGREIRQEHIHFPFLTQTQTSNPPVSPAMKDSPIPLNMKEAEAILVRRAMDQAGSNVSEAARLLGINRTKLYRKLAVM